MNDREVIAIMTDTLKSVREAIVYTFPPSELNTELYKRVTLAHSIGMDKLNERLDVNSKPGKGNSGVKRGTK